MPRVTCPSCRGVAEVDPDDVGEDVTCPSCGDVFTARASARRGGDDDPFGVPPPRSRRDEDDDFDDRPKRRRREVEDDEDEDRPRRRRKRGRSAADREEIVEDASHAVFLPALFSLIVCGIGVLFHIADGAMVLMDPQALANNPFGGKPLPLGAYIAMRIFAVVWELVIAGGSVCMMRLRTKQFVVAAMVMHIIPCAGICCIIGLPVGVWGLVTVLRADVAEGFEIAARE